MKIKNTKNILFTAISIVALVVLLAFSGMFDYMQMGFDFTRVKSAEYWSNTIVTAICYSLALLIAYIARLTKETNKNTDYMSQLSKYREILKFKSDDFTYWIDSIRNPKSQREAYIEHINKKLQRLDKWSKDAWRLEYYDIIEHNIKIEGNTFKDKKAKRYCIKRIELENMLRPDVIEKQFKSYSRYTRMSAYDFGYSNELTFGFKEDPLNVKNGTGKEITIKIARKFINLLIVAAFAGSITTTLVSYPDMPVLAIIIQIMSTAIGLVWSYVTGYVFGKSVFVHNYLQVIEHRINILSEYISYERTNGKANNPTLKVMNYIEEQEKLRETKETKEFTTNGN